MTLSIEEKYKLAKIYASSTIIPEIYKNNPSNIFIILEFAEKRNVDPMQVMQSTFLTHGKFTLTTAFAISLANQSGLLESGIRYEVKGSGDSLQVTASTTLKTKEEITYTVTMKMAVAEKWTKNSKYQTLPDLMLRYRAAIFLIRTHIPEVLNGCYTKEEMEDVKASEVKEIQEIQTMETKKKIPQIETLEEGENINLVAQLQTLIQEYNISDKTIKTWCEKANVDDVSKFPKETLEKCIAYCYEKYESKPIEVKSNILEQQVSVS
jgi:hypothetical protein